MNPVHRATLEGSDACASVLLRAITDVYGHGVIAWEPESIRLELAEDALHVPEQNISAILATQTLLQSTAYAWDPFVFAQTCLAFNGYPVNSERTPELEPAHVYWAFNEMQHILKDAFTPFDDGPVAYAASVFLYAGMTWAPPPLEFLNDELCRRSYCDTPFIDEIKKRWAALPKEDVASIPFPETNTGIQLALCSAAYAYVQDREQARKEQLMRLSQARSAYREYPASPS